VVPDWYAVAQGTLCLSVAWAILSLYLRGTPVRAGEPAPTPRHEPGLLWLGLAVAIWGAIGLLLLLPLSEARWQIVRTLLSSANNACLLISASQLDYGPPILQRASDYPRWNQLAIAGSLAVALITIGLYQALGPDEPSARLPDFLLSIVTLGFLGFGLFRSFQRRGFAPLALLASVAIGVQIVAQLPEIASHSILIWLGDGRWTLNLVSKAMVLVAVLSLAMSWVHELAQRPSHSAIRLRFTGRRVGARYLIELAIARVRGDDAGWVSLVDLVGRLDDSRIRRVREDLKPPGLDKEIEANGHKSYRLAIEPAHIGFDRDALARVPELAALWKSGSDAAPAG
jgi:hypothetical protein